MESGLFSFNSTFEFNGILGNCIHLHDFEKDAVAIEGKHLFGNQENPVFAEHGLFQENVTKMTHDRQLGRETKYDFSDEFDFNSVFSTNTAFEEFPRPENPKATPSSFQLSSLELLSNYGKSFKKLRSINYGGNGDEGNERGRKKLSTEEIMRVAGTRYVQFSDMRYDDFFMVTHPFGHALSGLSDDETKDVELVHLLLTAAEKVGYEQFERASRLLSRCEWIASQQANPVQRIVYYFAEALRERIDKATGRFVSKESEPGFKSRTENGLSTSITTVRSHQYIPFFQVTQFAGIQAIIENVESASKIHVIDLQLRSGIQWTGLMQALADNKSHRVELFKITAVGLFGDETILESGKRLESVAASFNLPFSFSAVYVRDMEDIKEELFKVQSDESLAVFCPLVLRTMISRPGCLENLMRVMKNLNPAILVVIEIEANHNSPSFVSRFIETLFFYSAFFDCLDMCLEHEAELRTEIESMLWCGIRNTVAMEGKERIVRNVKMEVWSAFFKRFRMVELGFSNSSLYQANLVIKQFPHGSCCTLEHIGKSVIVGWKGTPMQSISAWKFSRDRGRVFGNYTF
ncbi:Polycomb group protein MEDEA [Hibiscus syriacus]|uniref:Polycomb group protein MEDEA n=2 Tax=Hibiscus syriacus TaxID=106335 RepID=A0A6A2XN49_HIBSY|nr:Polycomb group protein MEDEA [Hibiscus syriacus]